MAWPAGLAVLKNGTWGRAGMLTGTTARSPLRAVSPSRARQRAGLLATATSAAAGKLTVFAPHSGPFGRWRSGLDARISNPPEPVRVTGTRTFPPSGEVLRRCLAPCSDTTRWLSATTWRADRPAPGVSRIVTVFDA